MNYEIVRWTPISGEVDEKHFGVTDTNPLWIKFNPLDAKSWIGSFAGGKTGVISRKIIEIDKTPFVGILTNGAFYLIDRNTKDLIVHPDVGYYIDVAIFPDPDLVVLATYSGITILKNKEMIKEIRPDFIDGIRFTAESNEVLKGDISEPGNGWTAFELDIRTLKLTWKGFEY